MLILPSQPRRIELQSFSIVSATCAAAVWGTVAGMLGAPLWVVFGFGAAAMLLGAAGWLRPGAAAMPYNLWRRLARAFSRFARVWLAGMCLLIVSLAGRAGSRMQWSRTPSQPSGWIPRGTLASGAYASQSDLPAGAATDEGWIRSVFSWGRRSGHIWVWSLIPFLLLLNGIQLRQKSSLGGQTYTLY